jgi:hypothetical protein
MDVRVGRILGLSILLAASVATAAALQNGDFSDGLTGTR